MLCSKKKLLARARHVIYRIKTFSQKYLTEFIFCKISKNNKNLTNCLGDKKPYSKIKSKSKATKRNLSAMSKEEMEIDPETKQDTQRRTDREEKVRKKREQRAPETPRFEEPVPLHDSKWTYKSGHDQNTEYEKEQKSTHEKEYEHEHEHERMDVDNDQHNNKKGDVEKTTQWKEAMRRLIEDESAEATKENQSKSQEWNEFEIIGWGCADPLLLPLLDENKQDKDDSNEEKTTESKETTMQTDVIFLPQRLIEYHGMHYNFNELSSKWKECAIFRRGANGVFGWGDNTEGQIGNGVENEIRKWTAFEDLQSSPIRLVDIGEDHCAYVMSYGGLYMSGNNDSGQCGFDPEKHGSRVKPTTEVADLKHVCQVVCGSKHTIVLDQTGVTYSFGRESTNDECHVLGRDTTSTSTSTSTSMSNPHFRPGCIPTLAFAPVVEIACGQSHCVVRTCHAQVFSWGKNHCGQLGLHDTTDRNRPTEVVRLRSKPLKQMACGASHTCILSVASEVICFGNNYYGQCGDTLENKNVTYPKKVNGPWVSDSSTNSKYDITQISCGSYHVLFYSF
ncbi:hypothetical protein RFI_33104 [Reticulomyxa filosa]|uniref:RCC1-like domain-containing protein n=1 Tax=Reticulomyxa filosa TaxID=46433 RepID=X6LQZ2_RETFI|nr:hypothetical protein RFI_33104 [Reticulomyxa filosa]|eukprot:ETO04293.1 hypothetical protein RFI_33104 [Reticulomyxa filosa]